MNDRYDQLERLKRLHDEGVLSSDEYAQEKARVLSSSQAVGGRSDFWGTSERNYCMFLHLSQLLGVIIPFIPFIGLIMPLVMWASEKDKSRAVDIHGRNVLNWQISYIIYFAISLVLIAILIGGLLLVAVIVANIAFSIIGGIKANNGEFWKYPLSIPFFKTPAADHDDYDHSNYGRSHDRPNEAAAHNKTTAEPLGGSAPRTDKTSTLSSHAQPTNANQSDPRPESPRDTVDPFAAETSSLNAAEGERGESGQTGSEEDKRQP